MGCLYCGKEIGPFRLLRDDEFCSSVHRKRYGERLGKVLDRIGAPELTPTGAPPAREQWPVQEGAARQTLGCWTWHPGLATHAIQFGEIWPLTIEPILGSRVRSLDTDRFLPCSVDSLWSNGVSQPLLTPVRDPQ